MRRIAVYGSLKEGDFNHDRWLRGIKPIGWQRIEGFDMYDLGMFPYVVRSDYRDCITVEVYEVPDDVAADIERMERGAGYDMVTVQTKWGDADMFVFSEQRHDLHFKRDKEWARNRIPSGNWPVVTAERDY
jgi:gamma-glutamylcyclotransferase (GGCT)/AIG2-like uncharacterized protein YtfP